MEFFFSENINNSTIILGSMEFRHCIKVMRHNIGDAISVVDGKGNLYEGKIKKINRNDCEVLIDAVIEGYCRKESYVHIGISPIKNHDRLEWFVEKSIEIGVDEISFINCFRTLREKIKIDRLHRTAIAALKQSLKAKLPIINEPVNINDFIKSCSNKNKFICHLENSNRETLFSFKNDILKNPNSCVLIGPEGDFTTDEIDLCEKYGFYSVALGDSRLRTETAGIVSCNIVNIIQNL